MRDITLALLAPFIRLFACLAWQVAEHICLTIAAMYLLGTAFWLTCLAIR
jgi:hypothetical protein